MNNHRTHSKAAFTLIELLVVIAIIALLVGILLPSLRGARDAARALVCQSNLRSLAVGGQNYSTDWKEYIAGVNTSGWDGQVDGGLGYLGDKSAITPTTTWDWISPTIGEGGGLSPNRAQRSKQIFERYGCPASIANNTTLFGGSPDRIDFENILNTQGYKAVSFLAPASFHRYPNPAAADAHKKNNITPNFTPASQQTPVAVNKNYEPRLDFLGTQPSNKVFAADGTRYLDVGNSLDFDITPAAATFSSFCDSGPIYDGSTAYGKTGPGAPDNLKLTYRHPGKTIDVAYYDGHASKMKQIESWKYAAPWYPGGSVFNGTNATPEAGQNPQYSTPSGRLIP
jgi:prepilin-type N-terminal cleavage/methylation domain-containing protein/prepilin-type processing-associated H-X9-DG protein